MILSSLLFCPENILQKSPFFVISSTFHTLQTNHIMRNKNLLKVFHRRTQNTAKHLKYSVSKNSYRFLVATLAKW